MIEIIFILLLFLPFSTVTAERSGVREFKFNGLQIKLDGTTGNLLHLSAPQAGQFLDIQAESAGFINIALQIGDSKYQRVTSRQTPAEISQPQENHVTIVWKKLSLEGNESIDGFVGAQVDIQPAPDGRSVIFSGTVTNNTTYVIRQTLFPDMFGLTGENKIRTAQQVFDLFAERYPNKVRPAYTTDQGWCHMPLLLRWLDIGNYQGGLSIFQKKWKTMPPMRLRSYLQKDPDHPKSPRLCFEHANGIDPGQTWETGQFWLTPHRGGWAKGIEVFREYVRQVSGKRQFPLSRHIADDIGFRTIWMTERTETNPEMADFRFEDIPAVAKEAADHGIHELVLWFWNDRPNWMPLGTRPELGTREEFIQAVKTARDMGVNVAPFYTVTIMRTSITNERYGLNKEAKDNYTYHTEFVPVLRPFYMQEMPHINQHPLVSLGTRLSMTTKGWQEDVYATMTEWADAGVPSVCWDLFRTSECDENGPAMVALTKRLREYARSKDPQSTFGGEMLSLAYYKGTGSPEWDWQVLDYTWNWGLHIQPPYMNVMPTPRINIGINASPKRVKHGFTRGLFLNVMPKIPDRPNGSAMIADYPALSKALKDVAALRKQFLPYFVDGVALGDSVLSEPVSELVRVYQLPDKLLFIVLNESEMPQSITLKSDLTLWLPEKDAYKINYYNEAGQLTRFDFFCEDSAFSTSTGSLQPAELALIEVVGVQSESDYMQTVKLNQWDIGLDAKSGAILKLKHPVLGPVIDTIPAKAGLIDIAYPIAEFPPLRLASRFSSAQIATSEKAVTITYDHLGMSRTNLNISPIEVSAEVQIKALPDGQSLAFIATVTNNAQSEIPVPQVLFPDFWGLKPVEGRDKTAVLCGSQKEFPFQGSAFNPESAAFYGPASGWTTLKLSKTKPWVDLTGPTKDVRMTWNVDEASNAKSPFAVLLQRKEADDAFLRLCAESREYIEPGTTWESNEYILTSKPGKDNS